MKSAQPVNQHRTRKADNKNNSKTTTKGGLTQTGYILESDLEDMEQKKMKMGGKVK